jgi:hypothetical protein
LLCFQNIIIFHIKQLGAEEDKINSLHDIKGILSVHRPLNVQPTEKKPRDSSKKKVHNSIRRPASPPQINQIGILQPRKKTTQSQNKTPKQSKQANKNQPPANQPHSTPMKKKRK